MLPFEMAGSNEEFIKSFNTVQQACFDNAEAHGWWDEDRTFGDLIALIHTELSEAFEEYREGHLIDEVYYSEQKPDKPEGVGVELADAVIRIMDLAGYFGIDLATLILEKHAYNVTRPYRHGGKVL
jgi:NTP pyrophosphatase (non-canonical NTP hydrolase)